MSETYQEIWPIGTGITDLPETWRDLASAELPFVRDLWAQEQQNLEGTELLQTFTERMAREWAIETGLIENLYQLDRGVTQTLIEQGFQSALIERGATNKPRDYVVRLLQDQKEALDGLFSFVKQDRKLTTSYIKELHAAMTRHQEGAESRDPLGNRTQVPLLRGEWKRWPNFPVNNGVELRYCPPEHTAAEIDRLVSMFAARDNVPPEILAAWLHHRFTQIHPFQDGNGRVARALASLVFIQNGLFPLVVTRDDKVAYLDALARADNRDLGPLVRLFTSLQQARFRRATYLSGKITHPASSIDEALAGLVRTARTLQSANGATESRVLDLHDLIYKQLTALASKSARSIRQLGPKCGVQVRSKVEDEDDTLERARLAGASAFGILPLRPCSSVAVDFYLPEERRSIFHVSAVDPNIDDLAQIIAFAEDGSRFPPVLCDEPLEWYPAEPEMSILRRLDDWVERAFIRLLERVQQSL